MAKTVQLLDGRELTINMNRVTIREWRAMFRSDAPEDYDLELLGRIVGLTKEEAEELGFEDWCSVRDEVQKVATNPLAIPG